MRTNASPCLPFHSLAPETLTHSERSGFRVITTCSASSFALVESYGADKALDYHSPNVGDAIRAYTGNRLKYAMDIIASAKSLRNCYAAIGRAGGRYAGFELIPDELAGLRQTVQASWVLGTRLTGGEIALGGGYGSPADPELGAWGRELCKRVEKWIWQGMIRTHPIELDEHGRFQGILGGLERLKQGKVWGKKLVYSLC